MPSSSLFATLLGTSFDTLPAGIKAIHTGSVSARFSGACDIERGTSWLGRLAATFAGMPPAGSQVALQVEITADAGGEIWSRHFGDRLVRSRLSNSRGLLVERLGLLTIAFRLDATPLQIRWLPQAGRVFGVPVPAAFFKRVTASESMQEGRYRFDVRAELPVIGLVIHYRGWLLPGTVPASGTVSTLHPQWPRE
jgi:hypothetical protein